MRLNLQAIAAEVRGIECHLLGSLLRRRYGLLVELLFGLVPEAQLADPAESGTAQRVVRGLDERLAHTELARQPLRTRLRTIGQRSQHLGRANDVQKIALPH